VQGGYNGSISAAFGSPIAGRGAWTGSSGPVDAMTRVEVDLGAFAGTAVRVRWRLAADTFTPGALPGLAWWIDDVSFVDMIEHCPLPPVAQDDFATTLRDTAVTIAVLANDSDPDGDALTVTGVTDPPNGSAVANPDGTVTYTPDAGFVGADSFDYTIGDGAGGTDSATVSVTVEDQQVQLTKASGSGRIPAGGGEASFHFNAQAGKSPPGRISYDASGAGGPQLKGTVTELVFSSAAAASLRGSCELAGGGACSFELTVEDNGEPGAGVDRFSIRVFDGAGNLVHSAGGLLAGGNIQVH
jgi:hypothetical protein